MIPAVIVSLVLVTLTAALPLTTQERPTTGINETPQTQSGIPLTILSQQREKIGVQTSEFYTQSGQYAGSNIQQQQVEKTGYQTPTEVQSQEYTGYNQQNTPTPKVENVPVNVAEVQSVNPQNPVLLPVQPLSVVPFNPSGQVLRPVVVPAEAIADGRVVIAPVGSIQQRSFPQEVFFSQENQAVHQQVPQPTTYNVVQTQGVEPQSYYVQPVEKQTSVQQEIQTTSQVHTPVHPNQETFNREQQVPVTNVVKQTGEPAQNLYQVEQNVQPESAEKQATGQVPVQVESNPQQQQVHNTQKASEKQVPLQQTQTYTGTPIVIENVEKYQPSTGYQTQNVESNHQQQIYNLQQNVEKQAENQQAVNYTPVQNPQVEHFTGKTEKHGEYQQGYTKTQEQPQTVEKQTSYQQQPVQSVNYVPVQQQVYSVQPEQVENQVPYHQQQNIQNVSGQILKTSEGEPNKQVSVQPQQVTNYAGEPVYNFGDKLPQVQHQVPVYALSSVLQENSVQPSVSSTQE